MNLVLKKPSVMTFTWRTWPKCYSPYRKQFWVPSIFSLNWIFNKIFSRPRTFYTRFIWDIISQWTSPKNFKFWDKLKFSQSVAFSNRVPYINFLGFGKYYNLLLLVAIIYIIRKNALWSIIVIFIYNPPVSRGY